MYPITPALKLLPFICFCLFEIPTIAEEKAVKKNSKGWREKFTAENKYFVRAKFLNELQDEEEKITIKYVRGALRGIKSLFTSG